jgi:protein-tyrosine phosphatase
MYTPGAIFAAMKILMVCLGNICRSPLAEGILEAKARAAGLKWEIDSAGTNGYHVGEAPHPLSQKVARLNGIDISGQRCRRFVKEDMQRFDRIFVMDREIYQDVKRIAGKEWQASKTEYMLNLLYPGENREVPDPWYGTEEGYHVVFELLDKACDALIQSFSRV